MANVIYPLAKKAFLDGNIDLLDSDIKVYLIDTNDYTYSAAHEFLDDITGIVATSGNLANKTTTGGTFDSDNPVFDDATGDPAEALILAVDTGTAGTSRLIAFYDTGVTGLPVTPNGGDINVSVHSSGWFSI